MTRATVAIRAARKLKADKQKKGSGGMDDETAVVDGEIATCGVCEGENDPDIESDTSEEMLDLIDHSDEETDNDNGYAGYLNVCSIANENESDDASSNASTVVDEHEFDHSV
jgi:hypothetical protein